MVGCPDHALNRNAMACALRRHEPAYHRSAIPNRWYLGVSQLTRLIIPVAGPAFVELGASAAEPVPRRSFFVEGRPAGMDTVFTQPVVAVAAWTGVGLRWR